MGIFRFAVMIIAISLATGCALHKQWRGSNEECVVNVSEQDVKGGQEDALFTKCSDSSIQKFNGVNELSNVNYKIGFVEINDQGELFSRPQMHKVIDTLQADARGRDVLIVVFAHGWNHRAKEGDGNISTFRSMLRETAKTERDDADKEQRVPREVFGVYVGWRGLSLKIPVIEYLSFWDRKNTAAKVGSGDVTELLSRIELIKRKKDSVASQEMLSAASQDCKGKTGADCSNRLEEAKGAKSDTRLVVIGHSFGGLVVQSAIDRILIDRAIRTSKIDTGRQGNIEGFGNLVVLVNPAFEAQRFNSVYEIQKERGEYASNQLPVELILTSQTDYATKFAFPAGRFFSTIFEKQGTRSKNLETLGHYSPFTTHHLALPAEDLRKKPEYSKCFDDPETIAQSWFTGDRKGHAHIFGGLVLERDKLSDRAPFLNVSVSGDIIPDHNDINKEAIIEFASRMISLSSITEVQKQRVAMTVNLANKGTSTCDL